MTNAALKVGLAYRTFLGGDDDTVVFIRRLMVFILGDDGGGPLLLEEMVVGLSSGIGLSRCVEIDVVMSLRGPPLGKRFRPTFGRLDCAGPRCCGGASKVLVPSLSAS